MLNKIDLGTDDLNQEGMREKLMELLVGRTVLDNSFLERDFEDLSGDDIDHIFAEFENNYRKLKNAFKINRTDEIPSLQELKKRKFGGCGMTFDQYKHSLIEKISHNKKKKLSKLAKKDLFMLLITSIKKENLTAILAYIDLKQFTQKINNYSNEEIQKFCNIINELNDPQKAATFTKTIFGQYNDILKTHNEDTIVYTINSLNNKDISDFFNVDRYDNCHFDLLEKIDDKEKFFIIYEDFHNKIIKKTNGQTLEIADNKVVVINEKKYLLGKSGLISKDKNKRGNLIFFEFCKSIAIEKLSLLINRTISFELSDWINQDLDPKDPFSKTKELIIEKANKIETNIENEIKKINNLSRKKQTYSK